MKTREEILQMVENEDVEFIRLQFTDMFGTLKNVAVTATQLQYMKDNRYLIDGSCMYGELRTGEEDMYLCPDLDTFVILPWRPQQGKVARLLCDVTRRCIPSTTCPLPLRLPCLRQSPIRPVTDLCAYLPQ